MEIETYLRPEFFRALADPTRLEVLKRLACTDGPVTVTEVADCCGVHLSGVSRHLAALRSAGVVLVQRLGREAFYRLDRDAVTTLLRGLADSLENCSCKTTKE